VLSPGISFVLIDNDGDDDPITGAFENLPEGALFAAGANEFEATYLGGSGNDLVLTVVPEPAAGGILIGFVWACRRRRRRAAEG
jgi:hypothetical protein